MFKGLTKIWATLGVLMLLTTTTAWAFKADTVTFNIRIENVGDFKFNASGVFNTPVGASEPGPLVSGGAYEFGFNAGPGDRLSFASMFVQSNDWFIAPNQAGLALFNNDGTPITGDVTSRIHLWDSGTELNQEPGLGPDQALQQAGPNIGAADPNHTVRLVRSEFDNVPAISDLVRVTLNSPAANEFVLRIENISSEDILITSDGKSHPTPFAPGVWVIHRAANPLFTAGHPDRGQGLEALAEDGDPSTLGKALANQESAISSGVFNTPVGAAGPGALLPGHTYKFSFQAVPGDYLSFATMFVQSNDLFYGPNGRGIALFGSDGTPIRGDVTDQVLLWDTGTEVNQAPGFGPDQAPRQAGPNSGADEKGPVHVVSDSFSYPAIASTIRVTITAQ